MMTEPFEAEDWRADTNDPLAALGVPVTTRYDDGYLVGFDVDSEARPTDLEAAILMSFSEFVRTTTYPATPAARMAAKPFDHETGQDTGHDTILLHKFGHDSWGVRRLSWDREYFDPGPLERPKTLVAVLDYDASPFGEWVLWKEERLELFASPDLIGPVPDDAVEIACRRGYGEHDWATTDPGEQDTKRAWMRRALEASVPLLGERPEPVRPTRAQLLATVENTLYRRGIDQHYVVPVVANYLADDLRLTLHGAERVPARAED
jgi:hypothetical protein